MVEFLKQLFSKPKVYIVEIEKPRPLDSIKKSKDTAAAVASLEGHAGFVYLLARLKAQCAYLQHVLVTEPHADMNIVIRLQAGIYWCNWLEGQMSLAKSKLQSTNALATPDEMALFEQIKASLEGVGQV